MQARHFTLYDKVTLINSLHVIETDAAYRNPRFRSIPSGKLPRMGLEKKNLFASEIYQLII